ncbi:twin-arginine translocation signal domain-containing protein, partial [Pseudomonas aeruginosa]|nr:twin-arginine translocation signal domain-containing protein [Pseudomonas aeruginosa]
MPLRHLQPDQDGDPQRLRQVAGGQGMKRSYPDDLVIGNLSRRGFLKGVGATGVLVQMPFLATTLYTGPMVEHLGGV